MVERIKVSVAEAEAEIEQLVEAVHCGAEVVIVREDGFEVELSPIQEVR